MAVSFLQFKKVSPIFWICSVFKIVCPSSRFSSLLLYPTHNRKITLSKTEFIFITVLFKNILWLVTALRINNTSVRIVIASMIKPIWTPSIRCFAPTLQNVFISSKAISYILFKKNFFIEVQLIYDLLVVSSMQHSSSSTVNYYILTLFCF